MQQYPNSNRNQNIAPENQTSNNPASNPSNQTFINAGQPRLPKSDAVEKINQLLWYAVGLINVVLILRIVFLLFNAQTSGFTGFLYNITAPFVIPFIGIFPAPGQGGTYFDTAALVAIIIYSLVAWGAVTLIRIVSNRQNPDSM